MESVPVNTLEADSGKMTRAEKVARRARLRDIRLVRLDFKLQEISKNPLVVMRSGSGFRHEQVPSGQLIVYCDIRHELAENSDGSRADPPFVLNASFGLVYELEGSEPLFDEDFAAFAEINGYFNAWPFVRELVHSLAGRAGVEPPVTPTLRIVKKEDEK